MTDYQPRYIAYSKAHNKTPDEMLKADNDTMLNFIIWIGKQWGKWSDETGYNSSYKNEQAHKDFDNWIIQQNP